LRKNDKNQKTDKAALYYDRLLDAEKGRENLKKGALVKAVCIFPNSYSVGMANIGFQTVYRFFNNHESMSCERGFFEKRFENQKAVSFETKTPLNRFDLIGFSVSFELDILNLIKILVLSNIPVLAENRTDLDPVVIAGGPAAGLNPSPISPFVDGLLVGDGEEIFYLLGDVMAQAKSLRLKRMNILDKISEIPGMIVYGKQGKVVRQRLKELDKYPSYTSIVTPFSHFRDMFVVEVSRGCPRGCRFCAARKIYKPFRFRKRETILSVIEGKNPGAKRIGLEGSAVSDYPGLAGLCEEILEKGYDISFSSVRADKISEAMKEVIKRSRLKTFTIAPEAGSEKLRMKIGKNLSDASVIRGVERLAQTDVRILKLYYMIGLPGETDEDIKEISRLSNSVADSFLAVRKGRQVRVSVNTFIPKPFTPFECEPVLTEKEIRRKRALIKKGIKKTGNIFFTNRSAKEEVLQAVLSLGDESVGYAMMDSVISGINWKNALLKREIKFENLVHYERDCTKIKRWE